MTPWRQYKKDKKYPELTGTVEADVAIIGGGLCGILCAYRLANAGKKVALVEKNELGTYATMDTTAFITEVIDSDLSEIISLFGEKGAQTVWRSGHAAIDEYDRIISEEKIGCEFVRCSNFVYAHTKKALESLSDEYEHYKKLGLKADLESDPARLSFPNHGFREVPDQAKFHVTKFLFALAEKAEKAGARIFEKSEASDITENEDGKMVVRCKKGMVVAKDVIIATYKPLTNEKTHLKKGMYRSYVFELRIPSGTIPEGLYEDTANPYHYFRIDPQKGYDRMIVGGEDHKDIFGETLVGQSFDGLTKHLAKFLKGIGYEIVNRWNGPILEPSDGLPLIGEIKPHAYVATAFSGNGMTYSMISSMILSDLILGKKNPWAEVYTPQRALLHPKRLAAKARDYVEEFFGGAAKNLLR